MSENKSGLLYKVETKRDNQMIKSFVKFTYRVSHPNVTRNFIIVGLVSFAFTYGIRIEAMRYFLLIQGTFCMIMGLFRHLIPINTMKRKDPDYIAGNTLSYEFGKKGIRALRNGEEYLAVSDYKQVTNLYHDEFYYYLGANEEDLMILPKDKFIIGDPDSFADFIGKKARIDVRWSPSTRHERSKQGKIDRAIRAEKAREAHEANAAEMAKRAEELKEARAERIRRIAKKRAEEKAMSSEADNDGK